MSCMGLYLMSGRQLRVIPTNKTNGESFEAWLNNDNRSSAIFFKEHGYLYLNCVKSKKSFCIEDGTYGIYSYTDDDEFDGEGTFESLGVVSVNNGLFSEDNNKFIPFDNVYALLSSDGEDLSRKKGSRFNVNDFSIYGNKELLMSMPLACTGKE